MRPLGEAGQRDPLQIGGSLYQQGSIELRRGLTLREQPLHAPTFVDGYLDGRPHERIQGFVKLRLTFDPTLDKGGAGAAGSNPLVVLDQLWLRFDLFRAVFITAGVQHLRWGTSRIWMTNDVFHSVARDPFIPFDARSGSSLVKVHVPVPGTGWNFYAVGILDNPGAARVAGDLGLALRAETTLGGAEIGATSVLRRGRSARWEVDVSSSLGPIDVHAEATLRSSTDRPRWRAVSSSAPEGPFESFTPSGPSVGASGGFDWIARLGETYQLTLGAEYFFNSAGYEDRRIYPWLLEQGAFESLYVGRHYVAVSAQLSRTGGWDDLGISLLSLTNLSDGSSNLRAGVGFRILAQFNAELFGMAHMGPRGGEFRIGSSAPISSSAADPSAPGPLSFPLFQVGIGLSTAF
ncbi:hypothetical protein P2318_16215 [Myxococcaceae bacterium GXIMD 01537]